MSTNFPSIWLPGQNPSERAAAIAALAGNVDTQHLTVDPGHHAELAESAGFHHAYSLDLLVQAEEYYSRCGYARVRVPWVVSAQAFFATVPGNVRHYATLDGYLVASAEQGFIQQLLDGNAPTGPAQAWTPCFRDEPQHDALHLPYFMKLELFNPVSSQEVLSGMVEDALDFFGNAGVGRVIPVLDGPGIDIITAEAGVELGSYGLRTLHVGDREVSWTYGTGVALPRLSDLQRG